VKVKWSHSNERLNSSCCTYRWQHCQRYQYYHQWRQDGLAENHALMSTQLPLGVDICRAAQLVLGVVEL